MSNVAELSEVEPGVKLVTLNRPQRRNAVTPELVDTLHSVVDELAADGTVRAVILTGAGRGLRRIRPPVGHGQRGGGV